MAQNFRRTKANNVGTSAVSVYTADSYDAIVGIALTNSTATAINVDCYITSGGDDIYLIKSTPIPAGSQLQIIDGGAKIVLESGDVIKVVSDTASSADVWVSAVDSISS